MAALRQECRAAVETIWLTSPTFAGSSVNKNRLWSAVPAFILKTRNTAVRPGGLSSHRTASRRDFRVRRLERASPLPVRDACDRPVVTNPEAARKQLNPTWPSLKQQRRSTECPETALASPRLRQRRLPSFARSVRCAPELRPHGQTHAYRLDPPRGDPGGRRPSRQPSRGIRFRDV